MPKVWCAAIDCEHNKANQCKAKEINLRDSYVHTVNDGYQHFNTCRMYEADERAQEMFRLIAERQVRQIMYGGNDWTEKRSNG